jgi:predicted GTPase
MVYTFEILGVSPVLHFFSYQQEAHQKSQTGVEYVGSYKCTLDDLIKSVETVPAKQGWELDQVVDTVINFWMNNIDSVHHWKRRLEDAGDQNLLVSRLANYTSLKTEFERLLSSQG